MFKKLQHKYALSYNGAVDMVKACFGVCIANLVLMAPAGVLYLLITDLLNQRLTNERIIIYLISTVVILAAIMLSQRNQFNLTFLTTYKESGIRRTTIAEHLRKLPLSYFGKKDLSDLTANIMTDCAQIETASSHWIPELAGAVMSTTIVGISLFAMFDWRLALSSFWVIPVAFIIIGTSAGVQKRAVQKNQNVRLELSDAIQEAMEAMRDIRANKAQEDIYSVLLKKIRAVESQALVTELKMAEYVTSSQMVLKLGIGTTALVGGALLANGSISIATFFMFLMLVSRLYDPLQISLQNFAAIISTGIQCERLDEVLSHPIQEGTETLTNKGYDIAFDHVSFRYSDDTNVLSDVSFIAKQGEVTALIGPSGGGKTTVSRLAARFWDIDGGRITVGGMDISKIDPETLLRLYSIVFQDVMLFNTSIMENIRLGRRGATDEEVIKAAKMAGCIEFITSLPNGFDTVIGENGSKLSGGERQRISIARAFLKDAPIILLDEATASLDAENETQIQQALSLLIKNRTVLIIAHRMRTIVGADHVVVLKDGMVAEDGKPAILLAKDSIFRHMTELQSSTLSWKLG